MANKMAEKKKNAGQSTTRNRTAASNVTKPSENARVVPAKSISAMARDERKEPREQAAESVGTLPAKSIGAMARDERREQKEQTVKSSKTVTRNERKETAKVDGKPTRRESRGSSTLATRFRNNRTGRFILDAYYELRHKVTWPTFEEARNMTAIVIALSVVIGGILALADFGLYWLFILIAGK